MERLHQAARFPWMFAVWILFKDGLANDCMPVLGLVELQKLAFETDRGTVSLGATTSDLVHQRRN